MNELKAAYDRWYQEVLLPVLKKSGERKAEFSTADGSPVENLYLPGDDPEHAYLAKLGFPGSYPYTRGIYPTMYRGRLWTMRQYAGFGDASETNRLFKYLLSQGQTGLSVAFDLCTQIGYDSDHNMSLGEVGKVGVAVDSLEDMELLFDGIPLDKVSTSMTINAPAAILLAMYIAVAEKQGVPARNLRGTIQNDILKEYVARGTYIFPPAPSMRLVTDVILYCAGNLLLWNPISVSGYHIREAGATAAQELGFTLSNAIAYVQSALDSGVDIDDFASRISFFFAAHNDLFEEVAKYRAARRLWAKIARERFHAARPESMTLRFHVQTAGCTLTAQQPENNIARVTIQALAAVAGGAQSLHTNSYDEALALPTRNSATIALRTQQVIAYESGVASTADPFGGSYYLEALTDKIEKEAAEYIEKIDRMGGSIPAIEKRYIQGEIQNSAYAYQSAVEKRDRIVVGVNDFISDQAVELQLLRVDENFERRQVAKLKDLRARRDNAKVKSCLDEIASGARSKDNLMPPVLNAVKNYCTIGEISRVLRDVFGEYRDKTYI